jgi:cyclohexanone monooxygenase
MRERGAAVVDINQQPEIAYAAHCREADVRTAAFRDCLSYYNGEGNAEPGSLAYYGGPDKWHALRKAAQETLEPYVFEKVR